MLIISVALFVIGIVAFAIMRASDDTKGGAGAVFAAFLVFSGLAFAKSMVRVVDPGYVAIPIVFGQTGQPLTSGIHFVNPVTSTSDISIRTQSYTMSSTGGEGQKDGDDSIKVLSKDGIPLKIDATVQYRVSADQATKVFQTLGEDYQENIVRPDIRTAIRDAVKNYNAADTFSVSLDKITSDIQQSLSTTFVGRGLVLEAIQLRDVEPSAEFQAALTAKQTAQQQAQAQTYKLQQAQQEAQIRIAEARGLAESQKIVQATLTAPYLQHEYIQTMAKLAGSPNTTFFITPFDQKIVPQISMGSATHATSK